MTAETASSPASSLGGPLELTSRGVIAAVVGHVRAGEPGHIEVLP
jgi:hypothetical protein